MTGPPKELLTGRLHRKPGMSTLPAWLKAVWILIIIYIIIVLAVFWTYGFSLLPYHL